MYQGYARPLSRLAQLFADTRQPDLGAATLKQILDCSNISKAEKQAIHRRISHLQKLAESNPTPHYYRILGVAQDCTVLDVKKAYRMLALRFHPDKAIVTCKFSCRLGQSGVDYASYGEICQEVREEASWLFKVINEANAALLDKEKRHKLDEELMDKFGLSGFQKNRWENKYSANASVRRNQSSYQRSWHNAGSFNKRGGQYQFHTYARSRPTWSRWDDCY